MPFAVNLRLPSPQSQAQILPPVYATCHSPKSQVAHGKSRVLPSTSYSGGMPRVEGAHNKPVIPAKQTQSASKPADKARVKPQTSVSQMTLLATGKGKEEKDSEQSSLRSGLMRLASQVDAVVNRSLFFHWARDNTQDQEAPDTTPFDPLEPPDLSALPSILKPVTRPLNRTERGKTPSPAKGQRSTVSLPAPGRNRSDGGGRQPRNGRGGSPGGGCGPASTPKAASVVRQARKRQKKADWSPRMVTELNVSAFIRDSAEMVYQLAKSDRPNLGHTLVKTGPQLPSKRRLAALEWCCIATKASVNDVRLTKMIWCCIANLHRVCDEPLSEAAAKSCMSRLRIESERSMRLYTEKIKDMLLLKDQLSHLGSGYFRHALRQEKVVAALAPKAIHEYYRWRAVEMQKTKTHADFLANNQTHTHIERMSCSPVEPPGEPDLNMDIDMEPILEVTIRMLSVLLQKPFRAEVLKLTTNSDVRHKMPQAKSLRAIALARSLASMNQLGAHTADLHGRFPADTLCASLIFKSSETLRKLFDALQNNPNLEIKAVSNTLNGSKNKQTVQEDVMRDFPCMTCQCIFTDFRSDKPLSLKYKDVIHTPKFSQIRAQVAVEQQAAGYTIEEARDHVAQAAGLLAGSGLAKQPLKIAVQLELYLEMDYALYTESRLCRTVLDHTNLDELSEDLFLIRETFGK